MAAATVTAGISETCIATFTATMTGATSTVANAVLILGVPTTGSPLYTFLSTVRADAAAAETAFRALGGEINARQVSGTATDAPLVAWTATTEVPYLTVTAANLGVWEFSVTVPHSLSK